MARCCRQAAGCAGGLAGAIQYGRLARCACLLCLRGGPATWPPGLLTSLLPLLPRPLRSALVADNAWVQYADVTNCDLMAVGDR